MFGMTLRAAKFVVDYASFTSLLCYQRLVRCKNYFFISDLTFASKQKEIYNLINRQTEHISSKATT